MSLSAKTGIFSSIVVILATIGFVSPWPENDVNNYLPIIERHGEITFITRNAPTSYFEGRNGPTGIEYELATNFANYLGLKPRFLVKDTISEITEALNSGEGLIAAAGLSQTEGRSQNFLFGPAYQSVKQQVVCRRGNVIPKNIQELETVELLVSTDTSYVETLQNLQTEIPTLNWMASKEFDTEHLLEKVWKNELDCTIADSNIVAINRRYFPELLVAFDLSEPEPISWLLPKNAQDIQEKLDQWYLDIEQRGFLDETIERFFGFVELFDYVDIRKFQKRIKHRLPRYQDHFQKAALQYNLHWTLLAAQSYQESHWRPRAKSPTGVRGIMMLTLPTAREMGVKSRLNARENIYGGARYLAKLRRRIPESVNEPDRTWMALAAYNVGMGHIHDARSLTKQLGKNPDKWSDLQETLPLLSQKQYYKKTKYGYARGSEPVNYVKRIRDFKDLLDKSTSVTPVKISK